ncbi:MAG: hypothetical protein L0H53_05370 [Candidatus Nitrosocosmicus sp.]|nr:hypothetical protein [Candidatus Nitrosocosmicus sp.]
MVSLIGGLVMLNLVAEEEEGEEGLMYIHKLSSSDALSFAYGLGLIQTDPYIIFFVWIYLITEEL